MDKEWFLQVSFLRQMAEIQGEQERLFRYVDRGDYSAISESGHLRVIKKLINMSKCDPRNVNRVEELERAEKELYSFIAEVSLLEEKTRLSLTLSRRKKKITKYWKKFLEAYCKELEGGRVL